jgi:hypothetical protein
MKEKANSSLLKRLRMKAIGISKLPDNHFGGCVISIAQIAAGRMYIDAR